MQAATRIDLNKHKLHSAVSAGHSECSNHANQMRPIMAEWPPWHCPVQGCHACCLHCLGHVVCTGTGPRDHKWFFGLRGTCIASHGPPLQPLLLWSTMHHHQCHRRGRPWAACPSTACKAAIEPLMCVHTTNDACYVLYMHAWLWQPLWCALCMGRPKRLHVMLASIAREWPCHIMQK